MSNENLINLMEIGSIEKIFLLLWISFSYHLYFLLNHHARFSILSHLIDKHIITFFHVTSSIKTRRAHRKNIQKWISSFSYSLQLSETADFDTFKIFTNMEKFTLTGALLLIVPTESQLETCFKNMDLIIDKGFLTTLWNF